MLHFTIWMAESNIAPCKYLDTIENAFGTDESGKLLFLFRQLLQEKGEKVSDVFETTKKVSQHGSR